MTLQITGVAGSSRARPTISSGFWLAGWMFTTFFARLAWWKALLAIVLWPYFLAIAMR